MAVAFEELAGSPIEWRDIISSRATMKLKCTWANRYDVMNYFVRRVTPYPHQVFGEAGVKTHNAIIGTSASCKGMGGIELGAYIGAGGVRQAGQNTIGQYEFAVVEVQFGMPKVDVPILTNVSDVRGRGNIISESFETTSEFLSLDPEPFRWETEVDGKEKPLTDAEAPGMLLTGLDYLFTRHDATDIPGAAFDLVDSVNEKSITPLSPLLRDRVFTPETMLYRGMRAERSEAGRGHTTTMALTYRFSIRATGWNKFFRGDIGTWDRIVRKKDGAAHLNHELGNFLLL